MWKTRYTPLQLPQPRPTLFKFGILLRTKYNSHTSIFTKQELLPRGSPWSEMPGDNQRRKGPHPPAQLKPKLPKRHETKDPRSPSKHSNPPKRPNANSRDRDLLPIAVPHRLTLAGPIREFRVAAREEAQMMAGIGGKESMVTLRRHNNGQIYPGRIRRMIMLVFEGKPYDAGTFRKFQRLHEQL